MTVYISPPLNTHAHLKKIIHCGFIKLSDDDAGLNAKAHNNENHHHTWGAFPVQRRGLALIMLSMIPLSVTEWRISPASTGNNISNSAFGKHIPG